MAKMGLEAIYKRPRTSQPHPQHPVYPYLLRKMAIDRPNQVWCADITFVPVRNVNAVLKIPKSGEVKPPTFRSR